MRFGGFYGFSLNYPGPLALSCKKRSNGLIEPSLTRFLFCNKRESSGELTASFRPVFCGSRSRGRNNPVRAVCKLCNKLLHLHPPTHMSKFRNNYERRAALLPNLENGNRPTKKLCSSTRTRSHASGAQNSSGSNASKSPLGSNAPGCRSGTRGSVTASTGTRRATGFPA